MLLSFDDEQILMWRGKDWKPMYGNGPSAVSSRIDAVADEINTSGRSGMHEILANPGGRSTRPLQFFLAVTLFFLSFHCFLLS